MTDPRIIIERDGGNLVVRVEPSGAGDQFAATYPTHRGAAPYARMVGKLRDWPVDDRTGEASA